MLLLKVLGRVHQRRANKKDRVGFGIRLQDLEGQKTGIGSSRLLPAFLGNQFENCKVRRSTTLHVCPARS